MQATCGFQRFPAGSILIECGNTRVVCAVTIVDGVPRWMREQNVPGGWLTAEYQMLPSATPSRNQRESGRTGPSGRTQEIQRLIGRSLRAVVDLREIGARTLQVDCDVLDADGGTRCAAITGAAMATEMALRKLYLAGSLKVWPMHGRVAAISVGCLRDDILLDLAYAEDSIADVDMNVVMMNDGRFIEVQGTAEGAPFTQERMNAMLGLARRGMEEIFALQKSVLETPE